MSSPTERDTPLADAFLAAGDTLDTSAPRAALEELLVRLADEGRRAWPRVTIAPARFAAYLGERAAVSRGSLTGAAASSGGALTGPAASSGGALTGPAAHDGSAAAAGPEAALRELRTSDLYLACGCRDADRRAIEAFEASYRPTIDAVLGKLARLGIDGADLRQTLLERLLVGRDDRPPAVALYSGRGDLRSYVRVAALHAGLKQHNTSGRVADHDIDELAELASPDDDPELVALKSRFRAGFKQAFQAALGRLDSAERNLLRYHYLSALTTRQIGAITGLDQSTVTRRLGQVRAKLLCETRDELVTRFGVERHEMANLLRLVESQIDLSIDRMLGDRD